MNAQTLTLPVKEKRDVSLSVNNVDHGSKAVQTAKKSAGTRHSRLPVKARGKSLKKQYQLTLQVGSALSLITLLILFRVPLQVESTFHSEIVQQEVVQLEEIIQTEQALKAPPPPRPSVPIEVPNDEVLEDEEFVLDVALDLDEAIEILAVPDLPDEPEPEPNEGEIFMVVEEMPQMIGGVQKLYEYVTYPTIAREAGLEGTVIITIVINEEGVPTNVEVLKSVHNILDESAVEAINKIRFTPGKQRGKAVRVRMSIPIRFKLLK